MTTDRDGPITLPLAHVRRVIKGNYCLVMMIVRTASSVSSNLTVTVTCGNIIQLSLKTTLQNVIGFYSTAIDFLILLLSSSVAMKMRDVSQGRLLEMLA